MSRFRSHLDTTVRRSKQQMALRLEPTTNVPRCESPSSGREGGDGGDHQWSAIKRHWPVAVCCALYVVLAMVIYGHFDSLGPGHMTGVGSIDEIVQIWWLAWAAHAVPHLHGLFLTQGQNYPLGQNFGVNGSMLALGIVFMPITKLFGPVVTWNILLRLALAASATSMCLVLRRWTTWWPAAFAGGLLYGFSPYVFHAGGNYLFLIFVPLPPVIFLLLHEILVRQKWRPGRTGALLGLVCTFQFFIFTEILAETVVMGAIAAALYVLVSRNALLERWRYAVTAIAYSVAVACLLLLYPTWFTFDGPQHINGPPEPASFWATYFPVDALSLIVPRGRWIDPGSLAPSVHALNGGGYLLYLGLPLIVLLVCFAVFFRARTMILFTGGMALIAGVLSLGPRLRINGHATGIPLPFAVFDHLPALDGFQTGRFALFTYLFAAGMFAIGIDEFWKRLRRSHHLVRFPPQRRTLWSAAVVGVVVAAVILPLVPSGTQTTSPIDVPAFFTSAAVDEIPPGSVVLTYPYQDQTSTDVSDYIETSGAPPLHSPMLDQAVTGMRYNLIGGYGWFPSPTGHDGTIGPARLNPQSVQTLFDVALTGAETPAQRAALSNRNVSKDLRKFLREYNVQTVVVYDRRVIDHQGQLPSQVGHSASVVSRVTSVIGPPVETDGLSVWFHVRQRLLRKP